jgi:NitT/TauT family transport system ATP-binding protein
MSPEQLVLDGIDLHISSGEFASIVGPSGCGKSTFMKLLSGLLTPQEGRILIDGTPISGPRSEVGMAFQNAIMLPWRTTLENILLPLEVSPATKPEFRHRKAQYRRQAEELLTAVGLEGLGDKYPWQLSGGMRQRASLCRAMIHEPPLLLLDEPFGALDAFTKEELWAVLQSLWQRRKFTVVMVTHDLTEAAFLSDTVYVMSARPGRMLVRQDISFPRPRDLDIRFEPDFVSHVHDLREHIRGTRAQANPHNAARAVS